MLGLLPWVFKRLQPSDGKPTSHWPKMAPPPSSHHPGSRSQGLVCRACRTWCSSHTPPIWIFWNRAVHKSTNPSDFLEDLSKSQKWWRETVSRSSLGQKSTHWPRASFTHLITIKPNWYIGWSNNWCPSLWAVSTQRQLGKMDFTNKQHVWFKSFHLNASHIIWLVLINLKHMVVTFLIIPVIGPTFADNAWPLQVPVIGWKRTNYVSKTTNQLVFIPHDFAHKIGIIFLVEQWDDKSQPVVFYSPEKCPVNPLLQQGPPTFSAAWPSSTTLVSRSDNLKGQLQV